MATTRRSFLINSARLAGGLAIASCAPSAPTTSAPSGAPVKKDLLVATAVEIADGQPYNQGAGDTYGMVFSSLYDTVTSRDKEFKLVPRIATSWSLLNPTTWQFKLRPGVRFHNGDPLTSADVKWSIEHTYDPAAKTIYAATFNTIARIDTPDELTVNIVTKAPDPFMPDKLSIRPGYVVPSKYFQSVGIEGMNKNPVGSGPYKFKERVSGTSFTLEKNPTYWRGTPDADTITFVVRPDQAGRIAALKTGEVHFITGVPYDQVDGINAHPTTKAVPVPAVSITMYVLNTQVKPLDNKLIRQAMSLAIDRPLLNRTLGKGLYAIQNGAIAPFEFGYDRSLSPLPFDANRAKALMQQAGYAGERIALEYNPQDQLRDQALAEQWKAVGFNIEMVPMDAATRARKVASLGFLGVTWGRFASRYGDPDSLIWRSLQPGGAWRYWSNAEFDRLGLEQASSTDQAARARIWARMNAILLDEMPWLLLWVEPGMWGMSKKIDIAPTHDAVDDLGPGHIKFLQ